MYIHFFGEQSLIYSAPNTFFLFVYLLTFYLLHCLIVILSFSSFPTLMRKPCCFIPFRLVALPFLLSGEHLLTHSLNLPVNTLVLQSSSLNSLHKGVACFTLLLWCVLSVSLHDRRARAKHRGHLPALPCTL